ncbi:hypothetical protein ACS0TY_017620 [Phlomoides rotata]
MSSIFSTEVVLPLSPSNSYSLGTHVSYSCGSCGYELNLNSCNRNISVMNEEYGKSMKRGVISFFSIDETRFTLINKVGGWLPYLSSNTSWRLFRRPTKLLCRNCGNYIGTCSSSSSSPLQLVKQQSSAAWDGVSARTTYEIKIRSLRPSSFEASTFFI